MTPPQLITAAQLADLWQLDITTVRSRTRRREIPAINIGTEQRPAWRYDPKQLDRWLAERRSA